VIEAVIQYWTEEGIALHRGGSGPGENLITPWEEPVEQKPNPTRTRDVEAERGQADLARFLQLTPPLTRDQSPYHRTQQFRADTARMLFAAVVNRLGIWEPCIPDVIQQTDTLIAALEKQEPEPGTSGKPMKASELIATLQAVINSNGDIDVVSGNIDGEWNNVESVEAGMMWIGEGEKFCAIIHSPSY
jgi:hypothetical protein